MFVYRNGPNYRNGLPEWTFICGFECLQCILCAQNDLQVVMGIGWIFIIDHRFKVNERLSIIIG